MNFKLMPLRHLHHRALTVANIKPGIKKLIKTESRHCSSSRAFKGFITPFRNFYAAHLNDPTVLLIIFSLKDVGIQAGSIDFARFVLFDLTLNIRDIHKLVGERLVNGRNRHL